jgi:2-phosphosulfolactate phosphatase
MDVAVRLVPGDDDVPAQAAAVCIDVLRATTTLTVALEAGAARVLPAATPEEAFALRARHPGAWVCGERGGRIVPGFDRGNSPAEYRGPDVAGRTLVFATTNGSLALLRARRARRRLLAAFVNASAAADALAGAGEVVLVCAGREGRFAAEDAACAGWLCERLARRGARLVGPEAALARRLAPADAAAVRAAVQGSIHGRALRRLGGPFAEDVEFCGTLDALPRAFEV